MTELTPQELARFQQAFGAMPYGGGLGAYEVKSLEDVFEWLVRLNESLKRANGAAEATERELLTLKRQIRGAGELLRTLLAVETDV